MSEFDRVFNLGRAYVGKAQDELFGKSSPESKAVSELNHALEQGVPMKKTEQQEFKSQISAMSDEEAEIILGVPTKAPFNQLKSQYELLLGHLAEFEKNQPEKKQIATREKSRIEKAFAVLSAKVDSTEKRFGSLEIE
jgi:hypothetical protein